MLWVMQQTHSFPVYMRYFYTTQSIADLQKALHQWHLSFHFTVTFQYESRPIKLRQILSGKRFNELVKVKTNSDLLEMNLDEFKMRTFSLRPS